MKRSSAILMPVFSLPSKYGIGTLGESAYKWIDFLSKAKQKYWQVLPLGPTSYGDSPYQSFSAFAGNAYFIAPEVLVSEGLLTTEECEEFSCENGDYIDYALLFERRFLLLKKAFDRFNDFNSLNVFREENCNWLDDYALYMALKAENNHIEWGKWDEHLKIREKTAISKAKDRLKKEIDFNIFLQYKFFEQWYRLKKYANKKGVKIIGDMPIYVAMDSADTWAKSDIFQIDKDGKPTEVAGCPPDAFTPDGQLWGNPLYKWDVLKKDGYAWWISRLKTSFDIFDVVRIDHFRGFESYYAIPFGDKTARNGRWIKGPDTDFINTINLKFKDPQIIAEDLGFLTPEVEHLLEVSGYPGMRIMQFAFGFEDENNYIPYRHINNCVVYTGTHDNDTMVGWIKKASDKELEYIRKYLNAPNNVALHWYFIRATMASVADLAAIPMHDYLELDNSARINIPSTLGGNWIWRVKNKDINENLAKKIADITLLFGRAIKPVNKKDNMDTNLKVKASKITDSK